MTYHHFYHILLITQNNTGTMWAGIIQGYEYQKAGITGGPSGKVHHMDFKLILLALPLTSHMYVCLYVCPERGPFYLCFSSMISHYGCTSPKILHANLSFLWLFCFWLKTIMLWQQWQPLSMGTVQEQHWETQKAFEA